MVGLLEADVVGQDSEVDVEGPSCALGGKGLVVAVQRVDADAQGG